MQTNFNANLVSRARNGDIRALETLVDAFKNMAVGYAYSILKDYQHAEDIAQESFIQAFLNLNALRSPEAFPSWFRKIVFSQCEHFYRKKRLPVVPLDSVLYLEKQEQSPPEMAERGELISHVHRAVKALPEKERTVTVLFYLSGYSLAEIGEFLDLPLGTVKNRLFSARKRLRAEMIDTMDNAFIAKKSDNKFTERVKNMIASGYKQALLVKGDGTVISWGNLSCCADPKTAAGSAGPAAVKGLKNVKSITGATGHYHSLALLNDGTVWAWGANTFQHLGTGSHDEFITTPMKVQNLEGVTAVATGVAHALALKADGSVWAWGRNWYGQLGNGLPKREIGGYDDNEQPAEVTGLGKIKQISAGYFHSLALAEDGTVWRWGGYGNSQFLFPIAYAVNMPVQISVPGKITAISAGGMHDVLLREDGTVWACGYNTHRQLGNKHVYNEVLDIPLKVGDLSDVKAVSAGGSFTLALKNDGTVWAWGRNENGELGNGSAVAKTEITLGDTESEPTEVSLLQDVTEITAGGTHAMAVTRDGGIWAWGGNDEGQLGNFTESGWSAPRRIM